MEYPAKLPSPPFLPLTVNELANPLTSFKYPFTYMLWWLKMSNISARNSSDIRSVTGNDLPRAKSAFHAPGPRKAFLAVIFDGKGPKVSTHDTQTGWHDGWPPGRVHSLNAFGFKR